MTMGLMTGGVGLVVCALIVWGVTASAARGSLHRNAWAGIRTAATQASDEAWLAGHRAAMPAVQRIAAVSTVLGVAMIVTGLLSGQDDPTPAVITVFVLGYGTVLVGLIVAARTAHRAAHRAARDTGR